MAGPFIIGYDATAAVNQRAGIGRYARELILALSRMASDDAYRLPHARAADPVALPPMGPRFTWLPFAVSDRMLNAFWQRMALPIPVELRTGRLDVFHSPDFSLAPSRAPAIVTIHDVAFEVVPQLSYPSLAVYLHTIVPRAVKRAAAVIVTSENTKADLMDRVGTSENKIFVIPEGVSPDFSPLATDRDAHVSKDLGIEGPFVLTVGTIEPRKNLERLLQAFSRLKEFRREHTLVIVGRRGWLYEGIFECRRALGLEESVKILENVTDIDLQALYRLADITVYAALYEGFGLPALEALASGSPLACSGNSALGELVGSAADVFDPWDTEDISETIGSLLANPKRQQELQLEGPKRAAAFTWEQAATHTDKLYHEIAAY